VRWEDLDSELRGGRLRPAYLLAGDEPLLRDESLDAICRAVLADGLADFNFDSFDAKSLRPGTLLDALRSLPVMATRRLVLLRDVPRPREKKVESGGDPDEGQFSEALIQALALLKDEMISSVLVVQAVAIDRRSKWVKAFAEPACVVDCKSPTKTRELAAFVHEEARRQNVKLGEGVAELLAEAVGPQLLVLRKEIEKLALFCEPGSRIQCSDVVGLVTHIAEEPVWQLSDAISEGRAETALTALSRLLGSGTPAPVVLGALANHFRKLIRLRAGKEVAGSPFALQKLSKQAKRLTLARWQAYLRAIHELDEVLKGRGGIRPEVALERLVIGLCG